MPRHERAKPPFHLSNPNKERKAGKVPQGEGSVPPFQPSIEGGTPESREAIRLLAGLLAAGYLRMLAPRCQTTPSLADGLPGRIPVDSAGQQSDELGAGTPGGRR